MTTMTNTPTTPSTRNIVDTAAANGSFKTFGKALERAGMSDTLRGDGPFTVFAPTDAAFDKLPAGQLDTLFQPEHKKELVSLLNYHVLDGRKLVSDIGKWSSARTINGQDALIKTTGKQVSVDEAHITMPDIAARNGVIHGIDKVNLPDSLAA